MGKGQSKLSFYDEVDMIASKYILSLDFQHLQHLQEPEVCDKMIIITKDILNSHFNSLELNYLANRTKKGSPNEDTVSFLSLDELHKINPNKQSMCKQIAKFYITIANIFAAIITTINPIYTFKDAEGNIIKKNWVEMTLSEATDKSKASEASEVSYNNICDNRLQALGLENGVSKVCDLSQPDEGEPGLPELQQLYFDTFNIETGKFDKMSKEAKEEYKKDLHDFYTAITGKTDMPNDIKSFTDVKILFRPSCNSLLQQPIHAKKTDNAFKAYANHVQKMLKNASVQHQELQDVLDKLFHVQNNTVTIHPHLNEQILKQCLTKTRRAISSLYINCAKDYNESVLLLESLIELKIKDSSSRQIETLEKHIDEFVNENLSDNESVENESDKNDNKINEKIKFEIGDEDFLENDKETNKEEQLKEKIVFHESKNLREEGDQNI